MVIDEFCAAARTRIAPGSYVLAWESTPMLHYLTDTRPYMYTPNPWYLSSAAFEYLLMRAERERPVLPVLVQAKGHTFSEIWPENVWRSYSHRFDWCTLRRMVGQFQLRHGYVRIWQNRFFEIWKPAGMLSDEEARAASAVAIAPCRASGDPVRDAQALRSGRRVQPVSRGRR